MVGVFSCTARAIYDIDSSILLLIFAGEALIMPQDKAQKTKKCPFCAETILAAAVKCRFCSEFLYPDGHPALDSLSGDIDDEELEDEYDQEGDPDILFIASPSIFAAFGLTIRTAFFIAVAAAIYYLPLEDYFVNLGFEMTEDRHLSFQSCRILASFVLAVLAVLIYLLKVLTLKSISYEVSPDRIEWSRGIFSRKIDNIDMFRVVDLKLHRSMMDCILAIGTVTIFTKDETDPQFKFYKVRHPKELYDILKKASLDADSKQGVIHIE